MAAKKKTKRIIIIISIAALIGVIAFFSFSSGKTKTQYVTAKAERGTIIQTVSETGTVKSDQEINLSFINSGRLAKSYVKTGDAVTAGQLLAELDYSDLAASREQYNASLSVAQYELSKLMSGATSEDISIAQAGVNQAKASYDAAQRELDRAHTTVSESISQADKTYNDLMSTAPDTLTAAEQAVSTAQTNLENGKAVYQKALDDARETGLTAASNKNASAEAALAGINRILTDEDAKDLLGQKDPQTKISVEGAYNEAMILLTSANNSVVIATANSSEDAVRQALDTSLMLLNKVFSALNYCFSALDSSVTSSDFSQTDVDAFKANINTQQTAIAAAISSVESSRQVFNTAKLNYDTKTEELQAALESARTALDQAKLNAKNALATARAAGDQQITAAESRVATAKEAWLLAQSQLNKQLAPADSHDVSLYQARVAQADASLKTIDSQIEKSKIYAPIDGTITQANYEVGEPVMPGGQPAMAMLGENNYEIEVLISEADIAKIQVEDPVEITLDAYGEDVKFIGTLKFIEPAETVIQDVVYYKVTVSFDPLEKEVKTGMTANAIITTAKKDDVLIVPSRAVVDKNSDGKFIRILDNGQLQEYPVTLGLRGDDGLVEILTGVEPGQVVVTSVVNGN